MSKKGTIKIALIEYETSEYCDVIEGPKDVLNNIKRYLGAFYEYAESNYYGDWIDYDKTIHLVDFLNNEVVSGYKKVQILESHVENNNQYKTVII